MILTHPTYIDPRFDGSRASRISLSTCSSTVTSFAPSDLGSDVTWRPRSLFEMGSRLSRALTLV